MWACRDETGRVQILSRQKVVTIAMGIPETIRFAIILDAQMVCGQHVQVGAHVPQHVVGV
ncbi:hypothetical protein DPMN_031083 [Dreissena polymorpha]|uniref:Uncharacterized protein n=1 Tax=Dreissena polymorpha TaxID=45954 RepID=A0A9D4M1X5_DREPO|nr:hypothetical protein DPMN_031083 [Dreissena polymorpha]